MQTLTITDAKKNLGRLLQAAAQGKDIGIISGADIIALRKVEVESVEYARHEYCITGSHVEEAERTAGERFKKLKKSGKLTIITLSELKKIREKAARR